MDSNTLFIRLYGDFVFEKNLNQPLSFKSRKTEAVLLTLALNRKAGACLLYTSPSPRDLSTSRMPSSA